MMLNNEEMKAATKEGQRRREAYIKKHPPEKNPDIFPSGWDEPMKPKGRRRRK